MSTLARGRAAGWAVTPRTASDQRPRTSPVEMSLGDHGSAALAVLPATTAGSLLQARRLDVRAFR